MTIRFQNFDYSDATWASWRFPNNLNIDWFFSTACLKQQRNIKALQYWYFVREIRRFPVDSPHTIPGGFSSQRDSITPSVSMPWCYRERKPVHMMTSSSGNIFRVTGPLCGKFTGHRWISFSKASDAELWCFLNKRLSKQSRRRWFETPSRSSWHHYNEITVLQLLNIRCAQLDYSTHTQWYGICDSEMTTHVLGKSICIRPYCTIISD